MFRKLAALVLAAALTICIFPAVSRAEPADSAAPASVETASGVTVGEVLSAAVCLYENTHRAAAEPPAEEPYESRVLRLAKRYGICGIPEYAAENALSRPATRAETVLLLCGALPPKDKKAVNFIACVPDRLREGAFVERGSRAYPAARAFYEAGIFRGCNSDRDFRGADLMTRTEFSMLLAAATRRELRTRFSVGACTFDFGVSGAMLASEGAYGYPLTAYRLGDGENVIFLTFCMHGYEDAAPQDGLVLEWLGIRTAEELGERIADFGSEWTVYLVPCCNPDGAEREDAGSTGIGRRTRFRYTDETRTALTDEEIRSGIGGGIDLNRCFPYHGSFRRNTELDHYTGDFPMGAPEAVALSGLAQRIMGRRVNIQIDVHGWYSQVLATRKFYNRTGRAFMNAFGYSADRLNENYNCVGYFSTYCYNDLGYTETVVMELPGFCTYYPDGSRASSPAEIRERCEELEILDKLLAGVSGTMDAFASGR